MVTSKVVSKAEGRVAAGHRPDRRRRGRAGRAGRPGGRPARPDHDRAHPARADPGRGRRRRLQRRARAACCSCRSTPTARPAALRAAIAERTGANVGVVVTDTAGRAWREGQTDIAIGAAGLVVLDDYAGRIDAHGNELAVTAPARRRRARRARPSWPRASSAAARSRVVRGPVRPGAAARRGRAGRRGAGPAPRARTCSGTAPARRWCARWPASPPTGCPFGAPAAAEELVGAVARVLGVVAEPARRRLAVPDGSRGWRRWRSPTAGSSEPAEEGPEKAVIRPSLRRLLRRALASPDLSARATRPSPEVLRAVAKKSPSPTARRSSTRSARSRRAPRSAAAYDRRRLRR